MKATVLRNALHWAAPRMALRHATAMQHICVRELLSRLQALEQSLFPFASRARSPSSIRLWETLGCGAMPVLIANTLRVPSDSALWKVVMARIGEYKVGIQPLLGMLADLRRDLPNLEEGALAARCGSSAVNLHRCAS